MTTVPVNGFMSNLIHTATLMVNFMGQQGSCQPSKANIKESASNAPNSTMSSTPSSSASSSNEFQTQISVEKSPSSPASSVSSTSSAAISTSPASPVASEHPDEFQSDTKGPAETEETPRRTHVPYILNGQLYEIQTQEGENVTVKCCHCPSNRVYRGSVRSTGNFHMHIKRRHPELLEKLHEMRVHALLERRDRILRSRRHRQCNNNRKRSTVFGSGIVANLQFTRANKTLRLKRTLSNISTLSRTSLTPNNSPPPRPQTSLLEESGAVMMGESEEGNRQSSQPQPSTEHEEEGEEQKNSPETHKLKIRTVFQRHKMQQLRNHQEAMSGADATIGEQGKSSTLLNSNGHLANTSTLQMLNTMQTEGGGGAVSASDLCPQSTQDTPVATTSSKSHCNSNYPTINYERKDDGGMDTSGDYQPAANLEKLNGEMHLTSFINRLELMDQALKQASVSASTLIKLENNYEVLDLSLRHRHSANVQMNQETRKNDTVNIVEDSNNDDVITIGPVLPMTSGSNNQSSILSNVTTINGSSTTENTVASGERPLDGHTQFTLNSVHLNKWEELIRNLDVSLRQLQQELSIRNYIERNRVCLDLAKFQFQNPTFQYKW